MNHQLELVHDKIICAIYLALLLNEPGEMTYWDWNQMIVNLQKIFSKFTDVYPKVRTDNKSALGQVMVMHRTWRQDIA